MDGKNVKFDMRLRVAFLFIFLLGSCTSSGGIDSAPVEPVETSDRISIVPFSEHHSGEVVFRLSNLDRSKDSFPVLFTENGCASGNRADDRFRVEVDEDQATISVTIFITEQEGDQGCPGNPWTPAIITLDQAIGTRQIVGVRQPIDDLELPLQVTSSSQMKVPSNITFVDSDETLWSHSQIRCEDLGASVGNEFQTDHPQLDAGSLLAQALVAIGGPYDSMYRHRSLDGSIILVQFFEQTPVASVTVYSHQLGWKAYASRCAELPGHWTPGTYSGELDKTHARATVTDDDLRQVTALLANLEGMSLVNGQLVFADPQRRCEAMIGVQDALEAAGWSVYGSRLHIDELSPAGPNQPFQRQGQTTISNTDGQVVSILTTANGALGITALASEPQTQSEDSHITPCFLDSPITVKVLPASS